MDTQNLQLGPATRVQRFGDGPAEHSCRVQFLYVDHRQSRDLPTRGVVEIEAIEDPNSPVWRAGEEALSDLRILTA